jgi:hypothetical protein
MGCLLQWSAWRGGHFPRVGERVQAAVCAGGGSAADVRRGCQPQSRRGQVDTNGCQPQSRGGQVVMCVSRRRQSIIVHGQPRIMTLYASTPEYGAVTPPRPPARARTPSVQVVKLPAAVHSLVTHTAPAQSHAPTDAYTFLSPRPPKHDYLNQPAQQQLSCRWLLLPALCATTTAETAAV